MQHDVGEAGDSFQALGLVEVGQDYAGTLGAPERRLRRVAEQDIEPEAAAQHVRGAAGDVAAADDQEFLQVRVPRIHGVILPDGLAGSFDGFSHQA